MRKWFLALLTSFLAVLALADVAEATFFLRLVLPLVDPFTVRGALMVVVVEHVPLFLAVLLIWRSGFALLLHAVEKSGVER